jgi:hypothetical protein
MSFGGSELGPVCQGMEIVVINRDCMTFAMPPLYID